MLSQSTEVRSVRALGWLCFVLFLSPLRAQSPADSPSVTIRSNVRLVQIDVIAKDKHGNPVPGLDEKDFTLLDDGVPQKIRRISVEHGVEDNNGKSITTDAPKQAAPATFSNTHQENVVPTVILLDILNTRIEDQPSMEKGLEQSLNRVKEGTPIALLVLGNDLTVISDFTTSSISLAKVAEHDFHPRPEGFGPVLTMPKTGNDTRDGMIRKAMTKTFRAEEQERMSRTLTALNIICERLGQIRGRKSLLWITGGLSIPENYRSVAEAIDRLNDANIAVYTVDARGVVLDPGLGAEDDPKDLISGIKEEREETRGDVLGVVAASTGGVLYHNTNQLGDAIGQAIADRSLVYVLDYYPTLSEWSGKLHKLQVKTSHPGVRLRYRASYRATLPVRPNAQEQQELLASLAAAPLEYAGIHFDVRMDPGPAADPRFVLHVPASEVEWSAQDGQMLGTLQAWFIQKRANGEDLATNQMKADLRLTNDAYQSAVSQGVSLASDLKLNPSAAKVRVMIRDEASGKVGTVDVAVDTKPSPRPPL